MINRALMRKPKNESSGPEVHNTYDSNQHDREKRVLTAVVINDMQYNDGTRRVIDLHSEEDSRAIHQRKG